jgi:hypothetical protein
MIVIMNWGMELEGAVKTLDGAEENHENLWG